MEKDKLMDNCILLYILEKRAEKREQRQELKFITHWLSTCTEVSAMIKNTKNLFSLLSHLCSKKCTVLWDN